MQFYTEQVLIDGLKSLEDGPAADVFLRPMREAAASWGRNMLTDFDGVDDGAFLELGVRRVLRNNESGRDFHQAAGTGMGLRIGRSAFFDLFKSDRRLRVLKDVSAGLYRDGCRQLRVDALAEFPALDGIDVIAGDGHLLAAACHAPRDPKGRKVAPNSLFLLNVRNGMTLPLSVVQGEGRYANELPPLRRHLPEFLKISARGRPDPRGVLMLVDMTFGDAAFWSSMKWAGKAGAKVIIPRKSNIRTILFEELEFDRDDPVNTGVVSAQLVAFEHPDSSTMRRVVYRDPETEIEYVFLTTEMDLPPGLVAFLYLLRWRIEKVFDVFKNKLHEKKAWGNGTVCQQTQTHFACMAHNLILMLIAGLTTTYAIEPVKLHRKRDQQLVHREQTAAEKGRSVNPLLKMVRIPSQVSCQFIRSLRIAIDQRRSLREHLPDFRQAMNAYI